MPQIAAERVEPAESAAIAHGFLRLIEAAELAARGRARLVARHAPAHVLVGQMIEVARELGVHVVVDAARPEPLEDAREEHPEAVHDRRSVAGARKRSTMPATVSQRRASSASCRAPRGVRL